VRTYNNHFYSGTSGLVLPVPNKQSYPPEFQNSSRLCYYGSLFNSIEVNSSFYKVPMGATVAKWADSVPDGFKFTFKLWRDITHQKNLAFNPADVERFMQVINHCSQHKGCLLVQFPPGLHSSNIASLQNLLSVIRDADPDAEWKTAIEFRHPSWYTGNVFELLDRYKATLVIHDMPASIAPLNPISDDFVYLRFHGPEGRYSGSYQDDFLAEYATYVTEWLTEGKSVYVYFNNTMGDALKNLVTLNKLIKQTD